MGQKESITRIVNEYINETSVKSLLKLGVATSTGVKAEQVITIARSKGISLKDIEFVQEIKISVQSLLDTSKTGELQSQMFADISAELERQSELFPVVGKNISKTEIRNIVKNTVDINFSTEAVSEMKNAIEQSQKLTIVMAETVNIEDLYIKTEIDFVGEQVSKMSEQITSEAGSIVEANLKLKEIEKGPITAAIDSVFGGLANLFGLDTSTVVMIFLAIIIAVTVVAYFKFGRKEEEEVGGRYFEELVTA
jgi:phage shock protein PspC (stress-responsive transcriptional regulator)